MNRQEGIDTAVYGGPSHVVILGAGASIASVVRDPEPGEEKITIDGQFHRGSGLGRHSRGGRC